MACALENKVMVYGRFVVPLTGRQNDGQTNPLLLTQHPLSWLSTRRLDTLLLPSPSPAYRAGLEFIEIP
jgi:hypothetical protein